MSIRLKLLSLMAFLFVTAISNTILTFQLESYGEEKLSWVNHTHEVINVTQTLLSAMKDAETGQRGFLLTNDISYLEPYHNGVNASKENFVKLLRLTEDNPGQQILLKAIENKIQLKFDELAETVALVQNHNRNEALQIVTQNRGKNYMDDIRRQFSSFTNTELVLLEQRKGDFRELRAEITTLVAVELIFFIALAIITVTFLQRGVFGPLNLLLLIANKVEEGEKIGVSDVAEKNEMGHLLSAFFMMSEKVSERAQILDYKAHHDELTGLKNRITLPKEIKESINDLQKVGGKLAVLFLDLNLFKQVNDTLGHEVGDLILKETAKRLNASVRSNDILFRVGGDEFLIIVKNIHNIADVRHVVDNILSAFEAPAIIQGNSIAISISIGVALSPDDTSSNEEIVQFADVAMYAAKRDTNADYKMFDKGMLRRDSDSK